MKRILYIITKTNYGGAQKYVHDLALNLAKREGFEVYLAIGEGPEMPWIKELKSAGVAIKRLKHVKRNLTFWQDFLSGSELYSLYQEIKPDVVHLNSSKIGATGSAMAWLYNKLEKQNVKIIYTVHGLVLKEPLILWRKIYYWLAEWFGGKFKDVLIAVSDNDRQALLDWHIAPENKIKTIYIGLDKDNLKLLDRNQARWELSNLVNYDLSSTIIIGTIAGYYKTKGLGYLIKAADQIIKSPPAEYDKAKIKFLLIGSGPEKEYLEKQINKRKLKGNVTLLSIEENAAQYLRAFDIFVLSSVKEGLPYTLIEARNARLPIIATTAGGCPEIITNQKTGLLVKPAKSSDLAKTISLLIQDTSLREQLSQNSQSGIEKFSLDTMIEETLKLY